MGGVVFETSGILDLRAVTLFGCNSKPRTTSPIGHFGTGLKYALAILAREGCGVTIMRGMEAPLVLSLGDIAFRDTTLSTIRLGNQELPFTTELGKNWLLWQAFRELESNTRDEHGSTYEVEEGEIIKCEAGITKIVITSDDFLDILLNMNSVFLDTIAENLSNCEDVEVYEGESHYVYYQGIRVYDLQEPSANTYNIVKEMDLSEDRTLKYWWEIEQVICRAIKTLKDETVLSAALNSEEGLEAGLNWTESCVTWSPEFEEYTVSSACKNKLAKTLVKPEPEPKEEAEPLDLDTALEDLLCEVFEGFTYETEEFGTQVSDDNDMQATIQTFIDEHYTAKRR